MATSGSGNPSYPPGYAAPQRSPTNSSYYDFNGTPSDSNNPNSQTWMRASDARAQQANVPTVPAGRGAPSRYPSYYGNKPPLQLNTPQTNIPRPNGQPGSMGHLHHPLIPGQTATYVSGPPGAVRSVYAPANPANFDVVYHATGGGFQMATYTK